jgi:hypothetical protein
VEWGSPQQRWETVGKSIKLESPEHIKSFNNFVKKEFASNFSEVGEIKGSEHYIGFKGEGLGMKIGLRDMLFKSVGLYNENNTLGSMGKKIISR